MLEYYQSLLKYLRAHRLDIWAGQLPPQISNSLSVARYGDLPAWQQALAELPKANPSVIELSKAVAIGQQQDINPQQRKLIEPALKSLIPWRKGPFNLFGIDIDSEWRSDWKWDRLLPHIQNLNARRVLDVGCGNGYHALRMLGAGAECVIGIDPSPRFVIQFLMIKHFLNDCNVDVLPLTLEQLPNNLACFDTTFSMGVFYHRRSPIDHLRALKKTLKPSGQLVLETLIIDGGLGDVLVPEGRYGMMRNVWFIPSAPTLISWLKKCGFKNPRLVDQNQTTTAEQRSTPWMKSQSLADFLDPENHELTREGHPAPLRGLFIAEVL